MSNSYAYNDRPNEQYYGAQSNYGGQQPHYTENYGSYEPPRDNGYRHDTAVERYDESRRDYDDRRSNRSRSRGRYYDDKRSDYEDREYSRERSLKRSTSRPKSRGSGEHKDHHRAKDVGATVIGGAVGAFAGHELGHNGIATTIGTLVGAWGGHELEKRHEKKKDQRRQSQDDLEYRRSSSRSREIEDSDGDYDDRPRHHHHHHRDADRYD